VGGQTIIQPTATDRQTCPCPYRIQYERREISAPAADHDLALARLGAEGAVQSAGGRRPGIAKHCGGCTSLPGDERQQRQAGWVRRGFWLRDGSWGPAPDQPGCTLPAELVAWCRRERQAAA